MLSTRTITCHALIYYLSVHAVCAITAPSSFPSTALQPLTTFAASLSQSGGAIMFFIRLILIAATISAPGKFVVETYDLFFHELGDLVDGESAQ
jgi:hypothetical protein